MFQAGPDAWRERILLVMINEGARCLEERVVATPALLDLAMILGTGFPAFRGGLLRNADILGAAAVLGKVQALEAVQGSRFTPSNLLATSIERR